MTTLDTHQRSTRAGRGLRLAATLVAVGFITTIIVAWWLAVSTDFSGAMPLAGESFEGEVRWSVTALAAPGALYLGSSRERGIAWSPSQATGAPDTPEPGDRVTAWASQSSDGQAEWLVLEYDRAVVPRRVRVFESYCPGAVNKVSVFKENGEEVEAWSGQDPTPPGQSSGVSEIPVNIDLRTQKVKLYLDSQRVAGWNEIDAVALVDETGQSQWASAAQASSYYHTGGSLAAPSGGGADLLVPGWCSLRRPTPEFAGNETKHEERAAEARGWPLLALWCERTPDPTLSGSVPSYTWAPRSKRWPGSPPPLPAAAPARSPAIPWRPIWGGLLADTLAYAVLAGLAWWVLTVPRRFVREVSRLRLGRCIHCGYDLNYDFAGGCPECGWRRPEAPEASGRSHT